MWQNKWSSGPTEDSRIRITSFFILNHWTVLCDVQKCFFQWIERQSAEINLNRPTHRQAHFSFLSRVCWLLFHSLFVLFFRSSARVKAHNDQVEIFRLSCTCSMLSRIFFSFVEFFLSFLIFFSIVDLLHHLWANNTEVTRRRWSSNRIWHGIFGF